MDKKNLSYRPENWRFHSRKLKHGMKQCSGMEWGFVRGF